MCGHLGDIAGTDPHPQTSQTPSNFPSGSPGQKFQEKNLKNLYDLFMSLKGEGTEDDPMFTTKAINCASCAKGVQNMLGFRADHINWNNFPFKDA